MDKRKRTTGQTTIYKTLHRKLKTEQHEKPQKPGDELSAPEGLTVAALHVTPLLMHIVSTKKKTK
jgi:hypothetical protein